MRGAFFHFIQCVVWISASCALSAHAILAGGEFDLPVDRPSQRVDGAGAASAYNFVGALAMEANGYSYRGSASAISSHWVLSAGHNVDFNDDGAVDAGLAIDFYLPGYGSYTASSFYSHPDFTGFGNPSIQHDLSLLYFEDPLPELAFPTLGLGLSLGDTASLVGYGRSGYGSYGYTTDASLTDRRVGYNVIDEFESSDGGTLFRYDFDSPDSFGESAGSLGNDIESLIGPGDSGGALLLELDDGMALVGVNTFSEGSGGLFGDWGGGIALESEWDWIAATTGLAIPEPSTLMSLLVGGLALYFGRSRTRR